jgi:hypothetical protein
VGSGWTTLMTNFFNASGQFNQTNTLDLNLPQQFFRLRVP